MDETTYHRVAEATLANLFERLEPAYDAGILDELELHDGILTIVSTNQRTHLISKHTASRQIWYATPSLGGLHFRCDETTGIWTLPDGRQLAATLQAELAKESVEVVL
jgi:iron donor protein CyaY